MVLESAPRLCGYILVKGQPGAVATTGSSVAAQWLRHSLGPAGHFRRGSGPCRPLLPLEDDDGRLSDPWLPMELRHPGVRLLTGSSFALPASARPQTELVLQPLQKYLVMAHHVGAYSDSAGCWLMRQATTGGAGGLSYRRIHGFCWRSGPPSLQPPTCCFISLAIFKRTVPGPERQRLKEFIDQYRLGRIPLVVPLTMLKHHFANSLNAYIDSRKGYLWHPYLTS